MSAFFPPTGAPSPHIGLLSPGEANGKADANAYAALMRQIREADGEAHTVIMMQVENEVGCPGGTRDRLPEAKAAFNAVVPKQLMDYTVKNKENLVPEFRDGEAGRRHVRGRKLGSGAAPERR